METKLYQWRSYSAWTGRCISDVLTKHADDVVSVTCKHKGDILLVTFLQCIGTTFFYPWRSKRIDDVLSVTFLQSMEKNQWHSKLRDDVKSVSVQKCMETTFYQWRSYKAWRQCFYQWHSKLREDVLLVTFQQCMDTTFYQWHSKLTDAVLSVTFQQCRYTATFYQWRSYSAWTGRFISDVLTKHADDVVSVTFKA